jgi:hypothetical protein
MSVFKVATTDIDLKPYGGEGVLKVRGLNTKVTRLLSEINAKYGKDTEDSPLANLEACYVICKNCIVDAPFDITDDTIDEFPPKLLEEIISAATNSKDNKLPLD